MKQIINIFSKTPQSSGQGNGRIENKGNNKAKKPKPKIIADYREKNSLVISELINLGVDVEIRELKVADYIVKDVAIERKTINDFVSSMINKDRKSVV